MDIMCTRSCLSFNSILVMKLTINSTIQEAKISLRKDSADDLGSWVVGDELELPGTGESVSLGPH